MKPFSTLKDNNIRSHYQEIDFMRGLALVSMVLFHTAFIAQILFNKYITSSPYFWQGAPMFIGGTFLTLSGTSLYIGEQRGKYPTLSALLKRSGFIFLLGMGLTAITAFSAYFFGEGGVVYFGILHCIGLGTFISFFLLPLPKYLTLALGLLFVGIGQYLSFHPQPCIHVSLFWLYPCYCSSLKTMLDYYPILPSLGFMLVGIFLGKNYYPNGKRTFNFKASSWLYPISLLGKHSLLIYCIHTPIVFAILYLIFNFSNLCTAH